MNLLNIIKEIETVDPEFNERISPRRAAIKNITSFGSKIAIAALPMAFATLFKKAYGQQSTADVNAVLNFALTLEYLESEFYAAGTNSTRSALFTTQGQSTAAASALLRIAGDENAHVAFLKSVLGTAAIAKPAFDFTAKGTFPTVFTNYDTFLAVAQAFEDTGVRAYKGQAPSLVGNKVVLTAALNLHSVEARHASHLRQMRRGRATSIAASAMKPWITGTNDTGIGTSVDAIYAGENNVSQSGVTITSIMGVGGNISTNAATEAFDEPLTKAAVLAIVTPFLA
ncbi:ferritin-like domain-containing protein [Hufsiella ginkgonis]|uniref:Ferritin-like domain-containing protein n=1 Tax=Hufsiella ginkgonis TaxID=2695274 RepID=A0A7K1XY80_9SPHI|nr:ferritin-like domain-containing protein [Hufsiella ginkgonis]MXV15951.1 ferritin-like domain-containing protein [Hufsiella ginkgonis]